MNKMLKQGFTLIELLAVVIILAILASLSIGSYKKSVEQTRFAEGLAAASAVVEAINRAIFDEKIEGRTSPSVHKYATLDVNLPNECEGDSGNCRATKYFHVFVEKPGSEEVVRAYRGKKVGNNYTYYIEIYTSYASSKDKLACVGNSANEEKGKVFCQSMGYTTCTGHSCTK